ncbi:uncharacterized protein LOC142590391 [Dermacentor variabilis]|uniref:uncharacterized protein LOC142590391 n=1 Tax=Dermacentor variabilis TaxID=34621 RepID=UPI003F5C6458
MLLRSRCSSENCRCEKAHEHHRSSKRRVSRSRQTADVDDPSQRSQGNGTVCHVSSGLSAFTFSPPAFSTPLKRGASPGTVNTGTGTDLSADVSLLYSASSKTSTTQSPGILRSSDATELQAKQVRFGGIIQNGSPRQRLYSDTDDSECEVSSWRFLQGVPNGFSEAPDLLNLKRSQDSLRSVSSTTTVTTTVTSLTDMPGTELYSDSEDDEELARQRIRNTTTRSRWPRPRSVYIVNAGDGGASPTLPRADQLRQHREAWLATAAGEEDVTVAATRYQESSLARTVRSLFFNFWKCVYVTATGVIVTDLWLLSRMTPERRKRLAVLLFALVMLPLLAWLLYEESDRSSLLASVPPMLASAGSHIYEVTAGASKAVGATMASFSFPPTWLSWGSTSGLSPPPPPAVPVELKKQPAEHELLSDERIAAHVEKALKRLALQFPTSHRDDEGATARSREEMERLKLQLDAHRITVERLVHRLEDRKDCCQDVAALLAGIDTKIIDKVLEVMNDTSAAAPSSRLQRWLTEEMDRREGSFGADLDTRLRTRLDEHRSSLQAEVAAAARQASEAREAALEARKVAQEAAEEARRVPQVVAPLTTGTADVNEVTRVVKNMLAKYDADKTGLPDYALESAGGSVVNTRCTDTYSERAPKYYMFGLPLWTFSRTAREAIMPGMHPGECWAFRGSQGHLVVKLAQRIKVTAFSVEHIPRSLVSSGHTSSAPKDFQMWGLDSETDSPGRLLGSYAYDADGDALQHFIVQDPEAAVYEYVEMKILSNHGNLEYTCLYRVRIHGEPVS